MSVPSSAVDLTSPDFDPLLALYSDDVNIPCPDILPFDNLAQYESSTKSDSDTSGTSKTLSVEEALQARKNKRWGVKDQGRHENTIGRSERDPGAVDSLVQTRRKKRVNVLTRLRDGYYRGPLALLAQSVYERQRVKVWTRAADHVRGYCTGFIVIFDKHFNMAMVDVDEYYNPPVVERETTSAIRRRKRNKKKLKEKLGILDQQQFQKSPKETEAPDTSTGDKDNTNVKPTHSQSTIIDPGEESCDVSALTEKLKHLQNQLAHLPDNSTNESSSSDESHDESLHKSPIGGAGEESCDVTVLSEKLKHLKQELAELPENEDSVGLGDKTVQSKIDSASDHGIKKSQTSKIKDSVQRTTDSSGTKSIQFTHYTQRHVDQLFIRGDNVVMVSLVDQ